VFCARHAARHPRAHAHALFELHAEAHPRLCCALHKCADALCAVGESGLVVISRERKLALFDTRAGRVLAVSPTLSFDVYRRVPRTSSATYPARAKESKKGPVADACVLPATPV
jgi:hypothetical protein